MATNDELPRDEHLRAALRHAPDAGLRAPALLSAGILAAAQRAAATAPPRRPWWRTSPWQGAVAAALLVSGVLWVQRDALPPALAPTEDLGEPRSSAAPAPPAVAAAPPAMSKATTPTTRADGMAAMPGPALAPARPPVAAAERAPSPASPPSPAPARTAAAAPSPPLITPSAQAQAVDRDGPETAREVARAEASLARARPSPAAAPSAVAGLAAAAAPFQPSVDFAAWSPLASERTPKPLPDGWMQALLAATPQWTPAAAEDLQAPTLREIWLWKDSVAAARLSWRPDRLVWCAAPAPCLVARPDPAAMTALATALPP